MRQSAYVPAIGLLVMSAMTFLLSAILLTNCAKSIIDPVPTEPGCFPQHSSSLVQFENKSQTGNSYQVFWDGEMVATLKPDEATEAKFVDNGAHTLLFKFAKTGLNACEIDQPILEYAETSVFSCNQ